MRNNSNPDIYYCNLHAKAQYCLKLSEFIFAAKDIEPNFFEDRSICAVIAIWLTSHAEFPVYLRVLP